MMRVLEINDFKKGFIDLLGQLTRVGVHSIDEFEDQLFKMKDKLIIVMEDKGKIIATGMLIYDDKFHNSFGCAGHIEDIIVHKDYRGKGLGKKIIDELVKLGKDRCYKFILDCKIDRCGFYAKCGFKKTNVQMSMYTTKL
jgi:glucosamine-phosphate N-acetyltransferase